MHTAGRCADVASGGTAPYSAMAGRGIQRAETVV